MNGMCQQDRIAELLSVFLREHDVARRHRRRLHNLLDCPVHRDPDRRLRPGAGKHDVQARGLIGGDAGERLQQPPMTRACGRATSRPGRTSPSAYGIVTDLTEAGYVVKHKDGRCNSDQTQAHLPLREPAGRERTIGELLTLLAGAWG
jgi:hypothetical protein